MKRELIRLLRCPFCQSEELSLPKTSEVDMDIKEVEIENDIREGHIKCGSCGKKFIIKDGILDLLIKSDSEILSEQKGWDQHLPDARSRTVSFPFKSIFPNIYLKFSA